MLPQIITAWHVEYFKFKDSEDSHMQEKLCDLSSWESCTPPYLEERSIFISKDKGQRMESEWTGFKFLLDYYTQLIPFDLSYLFPTFHLLSNLA